MQSKGGEKYMEIHVYSTLAYVKVRRKGRKATQTNNTTKPLTCMYMYMYIHVHVH